MTHRTAEQVEQMYLEALGPDLGPTFHRLMNECTWLHWKWGDYVALFGSNPERIELLNKAAGAFFRVVQDSLWEDVLLHISRLTDPPKSAGKDNLSITRLPTLVVPELRVEIDKLLSECLAASAFARDWRMRHIAHKDLALALELHGAEPLAHASRLLVREALDALARLLNAVESHYLKSELAFSLGAPDGALALLYVIRDGLDARTRRYARLRAGQIDPSDLHPPEL